MQPVAKPHQQPEPAPPPGEEKKESGEKSGVSRLVLYGAVVGFGVCLYGTLYRFPLVNGIDSPFFYPLLGAGFVTTIAAFVWWWWGRGEVLEKPSTWGSWVVGMILAIMLVGGIGIGGAFATWVAFVTLNGALDFGPAAHRSYTVAEFNKDCGGDTKDHSHYLLKPRGAQDGGGPILLVRANCSDDEGLPVDGGGTVPVGGEVVAVIKPGAFGEPWQAGYRAG